MEQNTQNAIIFEFNGLPGCGKSTISNALMESLLQEGRSCSSQVCRNSPYVALSKIVGNFDNMYVFLLLIRYSMRFSFNKERLGHVLSFINYYASYKQYIASHNEISILLIDEGLIQELVSIAYPFNVDRSDLLDKIVKHVIKKTKFVEIDCINKAEDSYRNIRKRNSIDGRFDRLDDDVLKSCLDKQLESFRIVREAFHNNGINDYLILDSTAHIVENRNLLHDLYQTKYKYA